MKRALTNKERETAKHAAHVFLDVGVVVFLVATQDLAEIWPFAALYVVLAVGNVWVVTDNIKAALSKVTADA